MYLRDYKNFYYDALGNAGYAVINMPPKKFFKKSKLT